MAEPWANKFYHTTAWKKCRAAFVKFKGGMCEVCHDVGAEVHHKIELTPENVNDPTISLAYDNLQLLCHRCHDATKHNGIPIRGDISFDDSGNVVHAGTDVPLYKNLRALP